MSLDVYLTLAKPIKRKSRIYVRKDGQNKEITREEWDLEHPNEEPYVVPESLDYEVFSANITHNLGRMASECPGLYEALWHPNENGYSTAEQLIPFLEEGLRILKSQPVFFEQFNPENGWGTYEGLVSFVEEYLAACKQYPEATVSIWI